MKKIFIIIVFATIFISGCQQNMQETETNKNTIQMHLNSADFNNNEMIPDKFTCKGIDINPNLEISGIPENTQSLALIMDDPDAPMGTRDHRIMRNIEPTGEIPENSVPEGAIQGLNSREKNNYGGPCPPNGIHRYFFKLYALDTKLNIPSNSNKSGLEQAMQGHIISQTELIGLYRK